MAPEQLDGEEVDARADQFAWGLTAFTLVHGKNPRIDDEHLVSPVPLGKQLKGVKKSVLAVLEKALAVDRNARYAAMEELVTALERALFDGSPASTPAAPSAPDSRGTTKKTILAQTQVEPLEEPTRRGARVWSFERTEHASEDAPFHVAAFSRDGRCIAAFGQHGMATFQGAWKSHPLPPALHGRDVRCCAFANDGESVIVGGAHGLAARIMRSGHSERWHPPKREPMVLDGVEVTPQGAITFVGRGATGGVLARVGTNGLDLTWVPVPLLAVVTLATGTQLACGPRGALFAITGSQASALERVTDRHLVAIARLGTGAVAVGAEGVAVHVDESLRATVENVRTTSSLTALSASELGAWAASDIGRLMKRDRAGTWKRVAPDWGCEPNVRAVWAEGVRMQAVASDGSHIEGFRRE